MEPREPRGCGGLVPGTAPAAEGAPNSAPRTAQLERLSRPVPAPEPAWHPWPGPRWLGASLALAAGAARPVPVTHFGASAARTTKHVVTPIARRRRLRPHPCPSLRGKKPSGHQQRRAEALLGRHKPPLVRRRETNPSARESKASRGPSWKGLFSEPNKRRFVCGAGPRAAAAAGAQALQSEAPATGKAEFKAHTRGAFKKTQQSWRLSAAQSVQGQRQRVQEPLLCHGWPPTQRHPTSPPPTTSLLQSEKVAWKDHLDSKRL